MGRIGAGELSTLIFGTLGPLTHLGIGLVLLFWGRSLMRRKPEWHARAGFYSAAGALLAALLGILGTVLGLTAAFGAVAGVDPSRRAAELAEGISNAMNATALGLGLSILLYVVSFGLLVRAANLPDRVAG